MDVDLINYVLTYNCEIEENKKELHNLKEKLEETRIATDYDITKVKEVHREYIKAMEKNCKGGIMKIQVKYNNLKKEKGDMEAQMSKELKNLEELHNKAIKELEAL
jgi:hypothetical protein